MKIILKKDIKGLGQKFEVKNVKPGYFRNFLLPRNLAVFASKENLKWVQKNRRLQEKEKTKRKIETEKNLEKIKKTKIKIPVKTGEKEELFEKITEAKIMKKLNERGIDVKKENILLKSPISKLGKYEIDLKLGNNKKEKVMIEVIKEKELKKKSKK